jgi:hypothetical protein
LRLFHARHYCYEKTHGRFPRRLISFFKKPLRMVRGLIRVAGFE